MRAMDTRELIDAITNKVLAELGRGSTPASQPAAQPSPPAPLLIPAGISNRHLHISREDLDVLFGQGHELTMRNPLKQPGEFACAETVTLAGPRHAIEHVRILGPLRNRTQVEISQTDAVTLGVKAPVRCSGDLAGTPGITIVGPRGTVVIREGVIRANRHIHILEPDAQRLGLKDKQIVAVKTIKSDKPTMFYNVMVRVLKNGFLELHIDTDDGNAAGLRSDDLVELVVI